jgi:hypothetical protein
MYIGIVCLMTSTNVQAKASGEDKKEGRKVEEPKDDQVDMDLAEDDQDVGDDRDKSDVMSSASGMVAPAPTPATPTPVPVPTPSKQTRKRGAPRGESAAALKEKLQKMEEEREKRDAEFAALLARRDAEQKELAEKMDKMARMMMDMKSNVRVIGHVQCQDGSKNDVMAYAVEDYKEDGWKGHLFETYKVFVVVASCRPVPGADATAKAVALLYECERDALDGTLTFYATGPNAICKSMLVDEGFALLPIGCSIRRSLLDGSWNESLAKDLARSSRETEGLCMRLERAKPFMFSSVLPEGAAPFGREVGGKLKSKAGSFEMNMSSWADRFANDGVAQEAGKETFYVAIKMSVVKTGNKQFAEVVVSGKWKMDRLAKTCIPDGVFRSIWEPIECNTLKLMLCSMHETSTAIKDQKKKAEATTKQAAAAVPEPASKKPKKDEA